MCGKIAIFALFLCSLAHLSAQVGPEYLSNQPQDDDGCYRGDWLVRTPLGYYRTWKDDRFWEKQYQDSAWPGRRDDELSDQLSR